MPVIQIQALPQPADRDIPSVLTRLCRIVADTMNLPSDYVSATWQTIAPGRYAVGDSVVIVQPQATHPVLVDVLAYELKDPEAIRELLRRIGGFLENALGLPGNVFVTVRSVKAGEVYDGGEVVGI